MKFVSLFENGRGIAGICLNDEIFPLARYGGLFNIPVPDSILEMLRHWDKSLAAAEKISRHIQNDGLKGIPRAAVTLLSPLPNPVSCRDGYAFRQHVEAARKNRGVEMIPEFDEYPVFYFTNHLAVFGEGDITVETDHLKGLDFELECAVVMGKRGKNISATEADGYIAGYMVMNDISARVLQMEEMKLNLGPAKGKDFATSYGPFLVTPDELENRAVETPFGKKHTLAMKAWHNGELISEGNVSDMNWTFAELIERASYGVALHPGEIIGSGTVGTGCYLELNGTRARLAREKGELYAPVWLKPGDSIELEIEMLGRLRNGFALREGSSSILAKKKNQPV